MLEKVRRTLGTWRTIYKRKNQLVTKLIKHPFFPLLFIGKFVEFVTLALVTPLPLFGARVLAMGVLAVVVTIIWVFAEYIVDESEDLYEEVTEN